MKIGINLVQYMDIQGIEIFALNVLRELVKDKRHSYVFFVNEKSREIFDMEGAEYEVVPMKNLSKFSRIVAQQTKLPRLLKKREVNLLFCPSVAVPLWYKKKIAVVHDCAWKRFREEAGMVSRAYLQLAMVSIKHRSLGIMTVSDFARLGKMLNAQGYDILLCGSSEDRKFTEIVEGIYPDARIKDIAGACSLRLCYGLLKYASAFVGNDSVLVHFAASHDIPSVQLMNGAVSVKSCYALGEKIEVLFGFDGDHACLITKCVYPCPHMKKILPESVLDALEELFAK